MFVTTVQEETRLQGARYFLERSGIHSDMFIAVDIQLGEVWYGALRISRLKFVYTSPGSHTLYSRGQPTPARAVATAIQNVYGIPLPPIEPGLAGMKLPVINVGMLGGGTVMNSIPQEARSAAHTLWSRPPWTFRTICSFLTIRWSLSAWAQRMRM